MKKSTCLFNKKALKKSENCVCYYCLKEFHKEELSSSSQEELSCPYCKWKAVLVFDEIDDITIFWVTELSIKLFG